MILMKPSYTIEDSLTFASDILRKIERAGRTCYQSEEKNPNGDPAITDRFIRKVRSLGHESVIEHEKMTVRIICDRGVTYELVRHRIASFSQESTRYCNYGGDHIKFILPPWVNLEPGIYETASDALAQTPSKADMAWADSMMLSEYTYRDLLKSGWSPQQARDVLPNSLKTEIVVTANLREWRHIFRERAINPKAHPQMREVMIPLLNDFKHALPAIFDDLVVPEEANEKRDKA